MRLYQDHMTIRVLGTVVGAGFILFGLYAVLSDGVGVSDYARDRATAFGFTAIFGGITAIFGSWAEKRVHEIWCAHPRRGFWRRRRRPQID